MLTVFLLVSIGIFAINNNEKKNDRYRLGTILTYSIILSGIFILTCSVPTAIGLALGIVGLGTCLWLKKITNRYRLGSKTYISESMYVWKSFISTFSAILIFGTIALFGIGIMSLAELAAMIDRALLDRLYFIEVPELSAGSVGVATLVVGVGVFILSLFQPRCAAENKEG